MRQPVAIVGIGCRFPGGVVDPMGFWRFLVEGRDAIGEIPADRIDLSHYYDPTPATPGRIMTRWGGFLDGIDQFDAAFFGISPREAERMDPQQRLLLETAWEAFEDAGADVNALRGTCGGVFVGQWLSDFEARLFADPERVDFYMTTGSGRYASSGRLSYAFDLHGPSLTIDTACSSSLAAIHLAARSVSSGESDFALAGGANVILQPQISIAYSQSRMMAPDGRCKFGDAGGDGYVRSEGAAIVLLKPLARAQADGDRIYALIRGSAANNDGQGSGSMGTPSRTGQEALLRRAYLDAAIRPGDVGYVEAHGTGTRAGDPVELGALGDVLGEGRREGQRAAVGSVKTNFGHTEGAAGIAGLIKVALSLHHRAIPPSLHCREPNPAVAWDRLPLEIARSLRDWPADAGQQRCAGVSAFGIAGSNAHVVLVEAPAPAADPHPDEYATPALLLLSARHPRALRELARHHAGWLDDHPGEPLATLCWHAATRRTPLEHRAAFVASDAAALRTALVACAEGAPASVEAATPVVQAPKVVFVFPGQGAQWPGMARALLASQPVFRDALARCDAAARPHLGRSLVEQLHLDPGAPGYALDRIEVIQPVLVALAIAYAELLQSWGVRPDAVIGHSMGEVGAAHVAGALGLDDAMRIVCQRSALMGRTSGRGAMAMVDLPAPDLRKRLAGHAASVSLAAHNSPRSSVISGDVDTVRSLLAGFEAEGVFCRAIKVDVASHSPQMEEPARALVRELSDLRPRRAGVPMLSTVDARLVDGEELGADYWGRNLRQPVRFAEGIGALLDRGATVFVELGPHPVLAPAIEQSCQSRKATAVALAFGRRDEDDAATLLGTAARLWVAGQALDWSRLLTRSVRHVDLPHYPWQRERHWVRAAAPADARRPAVADIGWDPAWQDWLHALRWTRTDTRAAAPSAQGTQWLVAADREEEGIALCDRLRRAGAKASMRRLADLEDALGAAAAARLPLRGVVLWIGSTPQARSAPVAAVQAIARAWSPDAAGPAPRLWLASTGAQAVDERARPRVAVDEAAAWGAGRVAAEEHPERWAGMVDLDPQGDAATNADCLVRELIAGDGEMQVAYRDGERFVLRLKPLADDPIEPAPPAWRSDASYLISGGLGAIGLQIAAAMVAQGARRLVLLGRTALPPRVQWLDVAAQTPAGRRIAAVRALEAAGASVHLLQADTADADSLARALQEHAAQAWPPIRGVVHAAGITDNRLMLETDAAAFERVVAGKLDGALHLDRLLPDLDAFVMCSSISAVLGSPGMANYAAANAGLDALAADRRARGLPALSIQWGPWEDTGLFAGEAARQNMAELRRQGIQGFTPAQGVALFHTIAGRADAAIAVMPVDWSAFRAARRGRDLRLVDGRGPATDADAAGDLAERLATESDPAARRGLLEPVVREAVTRVLQLAPDRLEPRKPFGTMGLSSLLAMELRNRLEARLARPLSATLAWNYPTLEALVGYLAGDADTAAAAPSRPAAQGAALPADIGAVADLSDAEAAQLLRRRPPR